MKKVEKDEGVVQNIDRSLDKPSDIVERRVNGLWFNVDD